MDDFLEWFIDFIFRIGDWLINTIRNIADLFINIIAMVLAWVIVVLLFPIWVIPFVYWYFFVRKKDKEPDDER